MKRPLIKKQFCLAILCAMGMTEIFAAQVYEKCAGNHLQGPRLNCPNNCKFSYIDGTIKGQFWQCKSSGKKCLKTRCRP